MGGRTPNQTQKRKQLDFQRVIPDGIKTSSTSKQKIPTSYKLDTSLRRLAEVTPENSELILKGKTIAAQQRNTDELIYLQLERFTEPQSIIQQEKLRGFTVRQFPRQKTIKEEKPKRKSTKLPTPEPDPVIEQPKSLADFLAQKNNKPPEEETDETQLQT